MISSVLPRPLLDAVIEELALAVVVLDGRRILYQNACATALALRLRRDYRTDLTIMLRDHVESSSAHLRTHGRAVSLVIAGNGEPFYIHLREVFVEGVGRLSVVCIRELSPERDAVRRCYGLSDREAEVVELVLRGYGNRDIASELGIAPATAKKHLGSIFNKIGVDSRAQLISRLA